MPPLTIQQGFELALQHHRAGRLQEAEQLYRQILAEQPEHAGALNHLGLIALDMGFLDAAVELIQKAISLSPRAASYHNNFGNALMAQGRSDEALASYQRALVLQPDLFQAHNNLGIALQSQRRFDESLVCFQRALALKPDYAEAHNNLGNSFNSLERFIEATACLERALALKPGYVEAYLNLGTSLQNQRRLDEAIASYQRALALKPDFSIAHSNMAGALQAQGRLDEAITSLERASAIEPGNSALFSSRLFTLLLHPKYAAAAIAEEHKRWSREHAKPLSRSIVPHSNDRGPERKLRIGYVSPDLSDHPVGRFLLPLFAQHDRQKFELFAYAQVTRPDRLTERFRSLVDEDKWQMTTGLSDQQLAEQIRRDQIDILVDLAAHTSGNRLLVFARKPAPVQVSYLGYPATSGLLTMDYRITDGFADPAGTTEHLHTETLVRLPVCAWCYQAPEEASAIEFRPAAHTEYVTFGCFNQRAKLNAALFDTWCRLLNRVPDSRLKLKAKALNDPAAKREIISLFGRRGIDESRLEIGGFKETLAGHLEAYQNVDIALDSFPYHGTMTTCEALWMGTPVVTLAGAAHVSRVGVSLLTAVGLPDLVASNSEEYIEIAARLAGDKEHLAELRATLRQRMQASPLMDAPRFARNMEAAYRTMWRKWCADPTPSE